MQKSKCIAIAAILVSLIIVAGAVFWISEKPKSDITVYTEGEKVGNTGFYFAGLTYQDLPPPNSPPTLTAIFKPTTKYGVNGDLEPTDLMIGLNLNGNTTASIGDEYYTIVSHTYSCPQTISMVHG